jgi:hypothetical protein
MNEVLSQRFPWGGANCRPATKFIAAIPPEYLEPEYRCFDGRLVMIDVKGNAPPVFVDKETGALTPANYIE